MKRIDPKAVFKLVLAFGDVGIVAGGFLCAYWLRFHLPFFPPPPEADFGCTAGTTGSCGGCDEFVPGSGHCF